MRSSLVYWNNTRISPAMANHVPGHRRDQQVPILFDRDSCPFTCKPPACDTHDGMRCLCGQNHAPRQTEWQHTHGPLGWRYLADIPVPARKTVKRIGKQAPIMSRSAIGEDANSNSSEHAALTLEPFGPQRARQQAYNRAVVKLYNTHRTDDTPMTLTVAADIVAHHTRRGTRVYAGCQHYTTRQTIA